MRICTATQYALVQGPPESNSTGAPVRGRTISNYWSAARRGEPDTLHPILEAAEVVQVSPDDGTDLASRGGRTRRRGRGPRQGDASDER